MHDPSWRESIAVAQLATGTIYDSYPERALHSRRTLSAPFFILLMVARSAMEVYPDIESPLFKHWLVSNMMAMPSVRTEDTAASEEHLRFDGSREIQSGFRRCSVSSPCSRATSWTGWWSAFFRLHLPSAKSLSSSEIHQFINIYLLENQMHRLAGSTPVT